MLQRNLHLLQILHTGYYKQAAAAAAAAAAAL